MDVGGLVGYGFCMIEGVDQTRGMDGRAMVKPTRPYVGEVVYVFAFDLAYDMSRKPVRELLGQPVAQVVRGAIRLGFLEREAMVTRTGTRRMIRHLASRTPRSVAARKCVS